MKIPGNEYQNGSIKVLVADLERIDNSINEEYPKGLNSILRSELI